MNLEPQLKKEWEVFDKWYLKNGIIYPRSTAVLKESLHNPKLEAWRLRVGWQESEGIKNAAAERGTKVHKALELIARGEIPKLPRSLQGYLEQFYSFTRDYAPQYITTERTLFDETHVYATTVDGIAVIKGFSELPVTVEYKTSKAIYPSHIYQAAAEFHLAQENNIEVGGAILVRINTEEYETLFLEPDALEVYVQRFLGFLEHFREFIISE